MRLHAIHAAICAALADRSAAGVGVVRGALIKLGTAQVGTFLHVKRPQWKSGDVLKASFGMRPRFVKLNDNRDTFDNVGSLHYGTASQAIEMPRAFLPPPPPGCSCASG